jgi:catechol 2,3-dioxygenase-like lactoylglutathione lyase family enzyme
MKLWNVGGKVRDISAEQEFLAAAGALVRGVESIEVDGQPGTVLFAEVGDTRVLVFESVGFEAALGRELGLGWSHLVFEVEDFPAALDRMVRAGARIVQGPAVVRASFSHRRIAFVESPGGCVYEVFAELPAEAAASE